MFDEPLNMMWKTTWYIAAESFAYLQVNKLLMVLQSESNENNNMDSLYGSLLSEFLLQFASHVPYPSRKERNVTPRPLLFPIKPLKIAKKFLVVSFCQFYSWSKRRKAE